VRAVRSNDHWKGQAEQKKQVERLLPNLAAVNCRPRTAVCRFQLRCGVGVAVVIVAVVVIAACAILPPLLRAGVCLCARATNSTQEG